MKIRVFVSFGLAALVVGSLVSGCAQEQVEKGAKAPAASGAGDKKEYNPHDVPITEEQKQQLRKEAGTFTQAVAKIKQFREQIAKETKNGIPENPYIAHQALDQADLLLQWLPEIARDSGMPKDRWEEINTVASDLRALFEKVHQNIDNKANPDFASAAPEIDRKIARLEEIAKAQPTASPSDKS